MLSKLDIFSLSDATVFQSECRNILSRMLNTVPSNVNLTDEITLLPAKVKGGYLAFEQSQLVFKASLRVCSFLYTFHSIQTDFHNISSSNLSTQPPPAVAWSPYSGVIIMVTTKAAKAKPIPPFQSARSIAIPTCLP